MNHIFKTVFNAALGTWQAVSELAKGRHKGQGATRRQARRLHGPLITLLCVGLPGLPGTLWAADLPQNGQVIAGNASITLPNGHTLNVEQLSDKAIIDWQSFNIGKGNTVNFEQNNTKSVALNRVTGNDPTAIYGNLNANGKVFLVNQNGVLFAEGANVNVGGLVASTLDIDNQDFLDGNYRFQGNGNQAVINRGNIHADGGAVALLGGHVSNEGIIHANLGSVAMAAGEKITLDFAGDGLINLTIDQGQLDALVENHGAIQADGGSVYLTTHAADQVLDSVVNNTGQIRAHTVEQREGKIILLADMQSGTANISGTLDASAPESANPNGGNGGFIETSGATVRVAENTRVTTRADSGDTGTWLIDPQDFTIADSGGDITGATLSSQLANNNVEIESVNGATAGNGDIFVNDTLSWSENTLTLSAERDIHINEALHASGSAGLALEYGQGSASGEIGGRDASYHINAPVNLASTGSFSSQLGSSGAVINYDIITDLNALQGINGNLGGNYVLGSNIDASATAGWNSGQGFAPIGDNSTASNATRFTGTFDGLGHVISDLFIDRETTNHVGLFGHTDTATLRHVGLENIDITGRGDVGGLVGAQWGGSISQAYASGAVNGNHSVGGLVGAQWGGSTISQSYASGEVNGNHSVGGLVGAQWGGSTISQSYASGEVNGNHSVGGLVGYQQDSTVSQSYASGEVNGTSDVGGLVGYQAYGSITNSFYATTNSDNNSITGDHTHSIGTGRTWAELMNRDTFAGWDDAVWGFVDGAKYEGYALGGLPYLIGVTREEDIVVSNETLFDSGWGTDTAPWTITNWHQLQNINYNTDVLGGDYYFNLVNDLGSSTAGYDSHASNTANSGQGWNPIGTNSNRFAGTFDGLGHVISDLFIDRETTNYVGLFGHTDTATLRHVGLEDIDITGQSGVGGLVGRQSGGSISQAYASGAVNGTTWVGGLVGSQEGRSSISQSYASGAVNGNSDVGGLVGRQYGGSSFSQISQSYATGEVNGNYNVGGVVGTPWYGIISNSFYATTDSDNNGITGDHTHSGYGTGRTWAELMNRDTFAGWDDSVWGFVDGAEYEGYALGGLPYLIGVTREEDIVVSNETLFDSGWGTDTAPWTITNWHQLQNINYNSDVLSGGYYFNLVNDLGSSTAGYDSHASNTANSGQGWNPIGNNSNRFTGTFDGLGHVISDLFIDRVTTYADVGLFGYTYNATLRHVGLENIDITGRGYVGGLVGSQTGNISQISQSYASGEVNGNYNVGGLVGYQSVGSISQSYASGTVNGNYNVGGLVGTQSGGSISQSYASGAVSGAGDVGGLVGFQNRGSISQSYATGAVTGNEKVGGLVGTQSGSISQSYASGAVSGAGDVGGLVGYQWSGDITNSFYATTDSDNNSITGDHTHSNYGTGRTWAELMNRDTFTGWDIDSEGGTGSVWRIYESHSTPLLRSFLTALTVTVDDDTVTYNGAEQTGNGGWSADVLYDSNLLLGSTDVTGSGRNAGEHTLSLVGLHSHQQGYDIKVENGTLTITAKAIDLINAIAHNKVYDGTTDADVTAELDGVINGDDLAVALSGLFDNKNAGTGKTVTVTGTLSGADAGNYTLSGSATATADITAKVIDLINAIAQSRVYDGTTGANVAAELDGVISGDNLQLALNGLFGDKNTGTDKTVTVEGTLSGADAGNYTLSGPATATADITAKVIDLINAIAQNKVYDGSMNADVTAELDGVISGDDLDVALVGLFDDQNADTGKTVTVNGALSGADAGNYTLSGPTTTTADITAKVIDLINAIAQSRVYDGTTGADVTAELDGVISGDDLQLALTGLFDNKNAGTGKDVTVTGLLTGADAGNYTLNGPVTTTADITAKVIDLINTVAQNREYNGTTDADVTAELDGVITGDDLQLAVNGAFDNKNAGTGKTVTVTGTLSGADAGNYTLSGSATATADITAKVIDLINAIAQSRVYDGTTGANVAAELDGVISGDNLQLALNGLFGDKNAGMDKTVTVKGTLSGVDASNYTLRGPVTATADISAKVIDLINAIAQNKVYDGSMNADVTAELDGVISGDDLDVALVGLFDDQNADTGKTVTVNGALSGADAGNYTLSGPTTTTADITAKVIDLINAVAQNRVYDGTTGADVTAELDGVITGDDLQLAVNGAFDNKNAGTNKTVTVNGTLSGTDAGNYTLSGPATATADITARVIDLINTVAQNRVYDGTRNADVAADLDGVISGDDLDVALVGLFDDKNAGTGKTVTIEGTLSGADAGNYTLSGSATATADITAKVIDLINAIAQNRVYDGTTGANVTADLDGVVSGDDLQLALTGLFDNKNAGSDKAVTVNGSLSGTDAGNYTLRGPTTTTADISAKVIDLINAVADSKVYDRTTGADVTAELDGVISGDDLDVALIGLFDDKNAGTGKTVTVNGALSGADAGNYTLRGPVTATADISAKVIDLINAIAQSRVYDGTTGADVTAELDGVISGDDLQLALTGLFDNKNAGTGKDVTVTGLLTGADAGNYTLNGPVTTTADITAKVIDLINTVAQNRVYDGTRNADVAADLNGVISGDDLAVALNGLFDDKNAGTGKTVTVNGTLSGADAGNYSLRGSTTATANISAKVIDLINAIAHSKVYDGTTGADVTAELDGVVNGDDLDVALSGLFEDTRVGDNKTVTVSGELSGGDSGNYQLRGPVQTVASITDPVLPVGYYAAIRAPKRMPIDVPSDSLLPLTIAGKGLNLQGLAGEVVLMTTGALGNRAADQQ